MSRRLLRIGIATLLILLSICSGSHIIAAPKVDRSKHRLLWRITPPQGGKPSYLFGTFHMRSKRAFMTGDSVLPAMKSCDVFAMEIHPDSVLAPALRRMYDQQMQDAVKSMISKMTKTRSPMYNYDAKAAEEVLDFISGNDYPTFMDFYFKILADSLGKQFASLEQASSQLTAIDALYEAMNSPAILKELPQIVSIIKYYERGEIDSLASIYVDLMQAGVDSVLNDRNIVMATSIDSVIQSGQTIFATAGAAHLGGPEGIVKLLERRGYSVAPVKQTFKKPFPLIVYNTPVSWHNIYAPDSSIITTVPYPVLEVYKNHETLQGNIDYWVSKDPYLSSAVHVIRTRMGMQVDLDMKATLKQIASVVLVTPPANLDIKVDRKYDYYWTIGFNTAGVNVSLGAKKVGNTIFTVTCTMHGNLKSEGFHKIMTQLPQNNQVDKITPSTWKDSTVLNCVTTHLSPIVRTTQRTDKQQKMIQIMSSDANRKTYVMVQSVSLYNTQIIGKSMADIGLEFARIDPNHTARLDTIDGICYKTIIAKVATEKVYGRYWSTGSTLLTYIVSTPIDSSEIEFFDHIVNSFSYNPSSRRKVRPTTIAPGITADLPYIELLDSIVRDGKTFCTTSLYFDSSYVEKVSVDRMVLPHYYPMTLRGDTAMVRTYADLYFSNADIDQTEIVRLSDSALGLLIARNLDKVNYSKSLLFQKGDTLYSLSVAAPKGEVMLSHNTALFNSVRIVGNSPDDRLKTAKENRWITDLGATDVSMRVVALRAATEFSCETLIDLRSNPSLATKMPAAVYQELMTMVNSELDRCNTR